ncbi:MAG: transposase [Colwellia sp.]|nr:transposase [Colwellia sp.]
MWKTVDRSTLKNHRNAYEDECLLKLHALLEQDIKVTILADSFFCDTQLFKYLKGYLKFNFVIRIRKNIEVTNSKGEQPKAINWLGKGGRSRSLKNASLTKKSHKVGIVVCVQAKGMKSAWCLAASDETLSSSLIIRLYGKRWGIEPQFIDSKDILFGMGLSHTKIREPQRRDRLLLISALSVVILTLLAAAGESSGLDKGLKANTVKHRTLLLFRQGYYYYHQLERMKKDQAVKLLEAFQKMLEEHVKLVEILGVI